MESLYLLIPIALVFVVLAVRVLFWAVNSGQFDDLDTEGQRILFDEETDPEPAPSSQSAPSTNTVEADADPDKTSHTPQS